MAGLGTLAAWVVLVAWVIGRGATDRWLWTQWVSWIPTEAAVPAAGLLAGAAWVAARGRSGAARRARGRWARRGAIAAVLGSAAWVVVIDWRGWTIPGRLWTSGTSRPGTSIVRLVVWNPSMRDGPDVSDRLAAMGADVLVLANAPYRTGWDGVIGSLGDGASAAAGHPLTVVSRYPILARGWTELGLSGRLPHPDRGKAGAPRYAIDPGAALYVELDTGAALGRSTVVWVVDLPSDPRLRRTANTEAARRAAEAAGFPAPDVIVGDFNIPRGAHSLRTLTDGMSHAFDQAGLGPAKSYPRAAPAWAIDHVFLAPWLRAVRYELFDPGLGTHRAQRVEIVPAVGPEPTAASGPGAGPLRAGPDRR